MAHEHVMEDVFHFARKGRLPIKYGWHLNLKSVRVGSKSLYSTFPHLYHLSSLKNCLVADFFFFLFGREALFIFLLATIYRCLIEKGWIFLLSWL